MFLCSLKYRSTVKETMGFNVSSKEKLEHKKWVSEFNIEH